jgi:hypothetical protein
MSTESFLLFALAAIYCAISFTNPAGERHRLAAKEQKQRCLIERVRTAKQRYFQSFRREGDGHNVLGRIRRR